MSLDRKDSGGRDPSPMAPAPGNQLLGYVGIEAVLDQMRVKAMKTGFEFNLMVVGESGGRRCRESAYSRGPAGAPGWRLAQPGRTLQFQRHSVWALPGKGTQGTP
uniref:Septin-type G domain-containing protein n=1 Tax=Ornithorhynchus anatinus TaxID=9258 RepID=A0A6I8NMK9_ORNAN